MSAPIFIGVLTLEKHVNGVWMTNLIDEIESLTSNSKISFNVEIIELDSLEINLHEKPRWNLLINRVSDAADPFYAKACLSVLNTFKIWNIPCFNGPACYSIGCSKYLHHVVFTRSGLPSPKSTMVKNINKDNLLRSVKILEEEFGCSWPFLIKPNSAGFGIGIKLFSKFEDFNFFCESHTSIEDNDAIQNINISNDNILLIQEYIKPLNNEIYRIWFLDGRVQCGLKRLVAVDASNDITFTNQCVGSVCSLPKSKIKNINKNKNFAWNVPLDVAREIENIVRYAGEDCHAGSVEFLYDKEGKRFYFDLNMLSTLPCLQSVENKEDIWPEDFNPWKELAQSVLNKIPCSNSH